LFIIIITVVVVFGRMLAAGFCLFCVFLAAGYWLLLAAGSWLLPAACWLPAAGFVPPDWRLLPTGCWLLAAD
jgi:hypothetical protein